MSAQAVGKQQRVLEHAGLVDGGAPRNSARRGGMRWR
jgi:hypothetical protein